MKYLIAGGWAAGTAAAQHLRKLDPSSEITVVDAESVAYYPRPDLIEYLAGRKSKDQLIVHGASWYGENRITLISGRRIMHVHAIEHEVTLDDGAAISYDKLLLANGASPFVPPLPGADQVGVFTLRTLDDADALLARIVPDANVVVVGGGLLGLEAARALAERRMRPSVIEFASRLLPNQLDECSAEMLVEHLRGLGVTALLGAESQQILSGEHGTAGVLLKDGRLAQGEFVLFSTGVRPNVTVAREAGIAIGRGVQVNDSMQTSAPDVYAAGDVVEHRGHVYGIIPPCLEQARVAAQNMVSPNTATYEGKYYVEFAQDLRNRRSKHGQRQSDQGAACAGDPGPRSTDLSQGRPRERHHRRHYPLWNDERSAPATAGAKIARRSYGVSGPTD